MYVSEPLSFCSNDTTSIYMKWKEMLRDPIKTWILSIFQWLFKHYIKWKYIHGWLVICCFAHLEILHSFTYTWSQGQWAAKVVYRADAFRDKRPWAQDYSFKVSSKRTWLFLILIMVHLVKEHNNIVDGIKDLIRYLWIQRKHYRDCLIDFACFIHTETSPSADFKSRSTMNAQRSWPLNSEDSLQLCSIC